MSNSISLHFLEETLIINIEFTQQKGIPTATIINYSGETIKQLELKEGINKLSIELYRAKNYSIRVVSGDNILVQKI